MPRWNTNIKNKKKIISVTVKTSQLPEGQASCKRLWGVIYTPSTGLWYRVDKSALYKIITSEPLVPMANVPDTLISQPCIKLLPVNLLCLWPMYQTQISTFFHPTLYNVITTYVCTQQAHITCYSTCRVIVIYIIQDSNMHDCTSLLRHDQVSSCAKMIVHTSTVTTAS